MDHDLELQMQCFHWWMRDVDTVEDFLELCELSDQMFT